MSIKQNKQYAFQTDATDSDYLSHQDNIDLNINFDGQNNYGDSRDIKGN